MKAFWWFEESSIAGMARPGFNCTRWFDFPFEQAVLVGWLGQYSSGSTTLDDFQKHVREYGAKILKFYSLDGDTATQALESFKDRSGILSVFKSLSDRSQLLDSYDVTSDHIHFQFNKKRLALEVNFLKSQGIQKIIALTESHHDKDTLQEHFETLHFSINDLDAPKLEQVHQLAEVLRSAKEKQQRVAVHCLAGIGRTSTMLITSHMIMGKTLEDMKTLIARQNTAFVFAGRQAEFILSLPERLKTDAAT